MRISLCILLMVYSILFFSVHESQAIEIDNNQPFDFEIYKTTYGIIQYRSNEIDKFGFAKFQLNFNKGILDGKLFEIPIDLSVAYTLRALWNIGADSAPFEDYSHNPELFFTFFKKDLLNLRLGIEHESNGKSGIDSRGWNRIYFQPRYLIELNKFGFHTLGIYLKVWHKLDENRRNSDISDFYGAGEVALKLYGDKHNFFMTYYHGYKDNGTTNLEYALRLGNGWALYTQYFDGYGEILVDYNKHSRSIGAGFTFLH